MKLDTYPHFFKVTALGVMTFSLTLLVMLSCDENRYMKEHPGGFESHLFGSLAFHKLLNQPNAAGISIEYSYNDDGIPDLLLVAVDKNGRKMTDDGEVGFLTMSNLCPPDCLDK
jgi:hypothetical protein